MVGKCENVVSCQTCPGVTTMMTPTDTLMLPLPSQKQGSKLQFNASENVRQVTITMLESGSVIFL